MSEKQGGVQWGGIVMLVVIAVGGAIGLSQCGSRGTLGETYTSPLTKFEQKIRKISDRSRVPIEAVRQEHYEEYRRAVRSSMGHYRNDEVTP
jgi:hypothetical protein